MSGGAGGVRCIAEVDVAGVAEALGDGSEETAWWYDPASGRVEMWAPPDLEAGRYLSRQGQQIRHSGCEPMHLVNDALRVGGIR